MIETAAVPKGPLSPKPLIVLLSSFGGKSYTFNVAYGVGKAGCDRLAADMHVQLRRFGVETVALYPGLVRTEGNVELDRRGEWAAASGGMDLSQGETPRFSGTAVVRLASDGTAMAGR
jgi:dehydrogenase/reductase SDR family protein 1